MAHDIKPGDIGLTQISGDVGKLIRVGQWLNGDGWADYEHAFVAIGDGTIVEAEPGGARHVPMHYDLARVVWLHCPPQYGLDVAQAALSLEGTPYSYLDYAALAARRLHIPAPHLRKFIADSGHMICSQLCDKAAEMGGWRLFRDNRWNGDVTPLDLWELRAEGGSFHTTGWEG